MRRTSRTKNDKETRTQKKTLERGGTGLEKELLKKNLKHVVYKEPRRTGGL